MSKQSHVRLSTVQTTGANKMELPKVFSVNEVADILGLVPISVRDACRIGRIPCNRRGARFVITEQQLTAYILGQPYQPKLKAKKQK